MSGGGLSTLRRLLLALPLSLFATSALVYSLPALAGLDPAAATLRARYAEAVPDEETLAALRVELGLDRSWPQRYAAFLADAARGDLGRSQVSQRPVLPDAVAAFGVSLSLVALAMTMAVLVSIPLGLLCAARQGGRFDTCAGIAFSAVSALPEHVVGPLAALVLGVWLGLLPTGGWQGLSDVVLPTVVLGLHPTVLLAQLVRAETAEALSKSFVRTARAKGLSPRRVVRHAFAVSRHGLLAMSSVMVAGTIGGAVVVEAVFSVPGIGRYLLEAVRNADTPALQAGLLLTVSFSLVVGAVGELVGALLDPRTRGAP